MATRARSPPPSIRKKWLRRIGVGLGGAALAAGMGIHSGRAAHSNHTSAESARVREYVEREMRNIQENDKERAHGLPPTVLREAFKYNVEKSSRAFDAKVDELYGQWKKSHAQGVKIEKEGKGFLESDNYIDFLVNQSDVEVERLLAMKYNHPDRESDRKFREFYANDAKAARKELQEYFAERAQRARAAAQTSVDEYQRKENLRMAAEAKKLGLKAGGLSAGKTLLFLLMLGGTIRAWRRIRRKRSN